jgi:hypothetical protein
MVRISATSVLPVKIKHVPITSTKIHICSKFSQKCVPFFIYYIYHESCCNYRDGGNILICKDLSDRAVLTTTTAVTIGSPVADTVNFLRKQASQDKFEEASNRLMAAQSIS